MQVLATVEDLRRATDQLLEAEPRFGEVVAVHGLPSLRRMEGGLAGLLRIVVDQLISLKAGESIWRRVEAELHPFDAGVISRQREASLRKLGLSGSKAQCFKAVAAAVAEGQLDFAALAALSDAEVMAALTALKGIGPWTAEIYLLSGMGRADVLPAGDLALQVAAQHLFGLAQRPDARSLTRLAEPWRPWRAVAARILWSHYRGLRGMTQ